MFFQCKYTDIDYFPLICFFFLFRKQDFHLYLIHSVTSFEIAAFKSGLTSLEHTKIHQNKTEASELKIITNNCFFSYKTNELVYIMDIPLNISEEMYACLSGLDGE